MVQNVASVGVSNNTSQNVPNKKRSATEKGLYIGMGTGAVVSAFPLLKNKNNILEAYKKAMEQYNKPGGSFKKLNPKLSLAIDVIVALSATVGILGFVGAGIGKIIDSAKNKKIDNA